MRKRYNTPHRSRVVKTRMTEEEYADFTERLSAYEHEPSRVYPASHNRGEPYAPLSPFPRSMTSCLPLSGS